MAKSVYIGVTSFNRPYLSLLGLKAVGQKAGGGGDKESGQNYDFIKGKNMISQEEGNIPVFPNSSSGSYPRGKRLDSIVPALQDCFEPLKPERRNYKYNSLSDVITNIIL